MKLNRRLRFGLRFFSHKINGIGIILTRRCNMNCPYCNIINSDNKKELTPGEWIRIIDRFIENKHIHYVFTGGEPFLYEGLIEVLKHAYKNAITSINTNLTLIKDNIESLAHLDFLTFSLDSLPDNKTRQNIDILKHNAKRTGTRISSIITVTKKNIDMVPEMISFLSKEDIWSLISMIHTGKGFEFRKPAKEDLDLTRKDINIIKGFSDNLISMKKKGYKISESIEFLKNIPRFYDHSFTMKCYAAQEYFEINNDGSIMACHDTAPSSINALEFDDYEDMKKEVKKTIKKDCNCFYDCYFNTIKRKQNPLKYMMDVVRYRSR